jgi:hypothetical protein
VCRRLASQYNAVVDEATTPVHWLVGVGIRVLLVFVVFLVVIFVDVVFALVIVELVMIWVVDEEVMIIADAVVGPRST